MDSTVDPGPAGFLGIFGSNAEDAPETEPETNDADQAETTAADPDSPEGEDLSADDLVAARLAASLEADGIEIPDPDDAEAQPVEGEADHLLLAETEDTPSLDSLSAEQLRALAEEAIRLRGEVSVTSRQDAARKVAVAEAAALSQVQAAYEQNVLAVSASHYGAVFNQRLTALIGEVSEQELPARAAALADQVYAARQQWESEQYEAYEQQARAAALNARKGVPEMRQLYAGELVRKSGLPDAAVAEVLKTTNSDEFPARVEELLAIRDALLAERARNQQQRRQEGNQRLREVAPRTAASGRPKGGKPPAYTGSAAEGARIISLLRRS
ncbi:MAG: hypothetical protein H0W36_11250 [Gemmatimonadetes bacterium]|nr:hypothetical protein [Gemmatimonadota bacterium]